jgi:hypothetical protein
MAVADGSHGKSRPRKGASQSSTAKCFASLLKDTSILAGHDILPQIELASAKSV